MKIIKGFKFIQENMKSKNGKITWKVGEWQKHEGELEICNSGFHACIKPIDSLEYVYGNKFFLVEAKGKIIKGDDKFVASEMRLIKELPADKIFKRFAIACAKLCIKNYEKKYPNDKRPFEAIKAAEDYLDGKIKLAELNEKLSAAESAAESAWSAAESAARSAARSAAESAWSAENKILLKIIKENS